MHFSQTNTLWPGELSNLAAWNQIDMRGLVQQGLLRTAALLPNWMARFDKPVQVVPNQTTYVNKQTNPNGLTHSILDICQTVQ